MSDELRVNEIFLSLQGEGLHTGELTSFVRLTGCPLRCGYCDTAYAFSEGEWRSQAQILAQVAELGATRVLVTGGEPLAQRPTPSLLQALCEAGQPVDLETSGALSIDGLDPRVGVILDIKTPGSGEVERNHWDNLDLLRPTDQIKLVLTGRSDYDWARAIVKQHRLLERAPVLFSPAAESLAARTLADWIVADRLPVRLQVQLHKLLWGEERGR